MSSSPTPYKHTEISLLSFQFVFYCSSYLSYLLIAFHNIFCGKNCSICYSGYIFFLEKKTTRYNIVGFRNMLLQ